MRKLVALLAGLIFVANLVSCTSKDSKDDAMGDEAVAESAETDSELDSMDAPADGAQASNEGFLDEQLPEEALGESTSTASNETPPPEAAPADAPPPDDMGDMSLSESPPPPADPVAESEPPPPPLEEPTATASVDTGSNSSFNTEPAPLDTTSSSLSSSEPESSSSTVAASEESPKPKASLKKIEAAPFTRSGVLLNAVYVARPKDDYKKISKMIYGDNKKAKELKKVNPAIGSPKAGDKIYYNSPTRPTDDTKLLTFYEDAGIVPEVYVAQDGDDLKKVSKKLLGYDNAWKEVWATNVAVESKGALTAGTELRYWKSAPPPPAPVEAAPPMGDVAMTDPAAAAPPMPDMPPAPPMGEMDLPPPPPVAQADIPPPPPVSGDMAAPGGEMAPPMGEMAPPPSELPPPPPAEAVNPPPPPPQIPKKVAGNQGGLVEGMDQDMIMTLGAAGIFAAGFVLLLVIRRKRQQREIASAFNDTQVGT